MPSKSKSNSKSKSKSKSKSSSKSKSTSLESVSSELHLLDLADDLFTSIQFNNDNKRAISILRKEPLLANHEYDENYVDFKGTPLMYCCFYRNYTVAKELLKKEYNIDIEYKNEHNQTPLTMAGEGHDETGNSFKIIKLLIKKGADINHMDNEGDTLFSGICKSFNSPHIEYLLKIPELDINKKKRGEDSPFHILILKFCQIGYHDEYIRIIKKVLNDPRLDINIKGYNGETVLHILASVDRQYDHNYSIESLKKLIDLLFINGVDPDITDSDGVSPLSNDIVRECYEIYFRRKLNQAENRLALAKLAKELNDEGGRIDEGILIKISKEIPFLSEKQLNVIDKKILAENIRSSYKSPDLDNMVEVYREQLQNPKLLPKHRKIIRKKKRKYKIRKKIPLGSSDLSSSRNSRSSPSEDLRDAIKMSVRESKSDKTNSRKSRSLRSSEELEKALKMSIQEAKSGSKNKKKKTIKK